MDASLIIMEQAEIIDRLIELNKETMKLLSQHMACDEYDKKLKEITDPEA